MTMMTDFVTAHVTSMTPILLAILLLFAGDLNRLQAAEPVDRPPEVEPIILCRNPTKGDQDDLAFWIDEQNPARSVVFASDKKGGQIISYDLDGNVLQVVKVGKPGNIDIRQSVTLNGQTMDLVVWNQREPDFRIRVCRFDAKSRKIDFIDADGIPTEPNYGGTLYHNKQTQRIYFLATSKGPSEVSQYELATDDKGLVSGKKVRGWSFQLCECAVADEHEGVFYLAVEDEGIWKLPADPKDPQQPVQILKVGEHGLVPDLEGLALTDGHDGKRWLIVSSQGSNTFRVFETQPLYRFVGAFAVKGAVASDGIDLCSRSLGPQFPHGVFGCHTDIDGHPILLSDWGQIRQVLNAR